MRDRHQLLRNLSDALTTVGNSLVVVSTESNHPKFLDLNALVVSLEAMKCREDAIGFLFPKKPEAVKCNDRKLELTKRELKKVSSGNSHTDDSKNPCSSNASMIESQESRMEFENEHGDIKRLYGQFSKTFDGSEIEKLGDPNNFGNLACNVSQIKLEVETSISFLKIAMIHVNQSKHPQDCDGDLSSELKCMLDELQQLSNDLDKRDNELENISSIGKILTNFREQRLRLQPFLDLLFLPSDYCKTQEFTEATADSSKQGKGSRAKENNKSKQKKKGKKKR